MLPVYVIKPARRRGGPSRAAHPAGRSGAPHGVRSHPLAGRVVPMRCVVINLPVASERREAIGREFGKVGLDYEIWEAVDGSRLTEEELASVDNETRNRLGYDEMDRPALACLLSHTAALRSLADSEDEVIAVFEDDASFTRTSPASSPPWKRSRRGSTS